MAWPKGRPRNPTTGAPMTEGEKALSDITAPAKKMEATAPPPKRSGGKVTIACKLPIPWLDLRLTYLVEKEQPGLNGSRVVREAVFSGEFIRIRGTAYPRAGGVPEGFPQKPMMMNGFALTPNVDEDKWDAWMEIGGGKHSAMVKNGLLFAYTDLSNIKARTLEMRDFQTGLEPLDPRVDDKGRGIDPRAPRRTTVGNVQPGQVNTDADSETQLYELLEQQEQRQQVGGG